MDENQRYHVMKIRPDVYNRIAEYATRRGCSLNEAARDLMGGGGVNGDAAGAGGPGNSSAVGASSGPAGPDAVNSGTANSGLAGVDAVLRGLELADRLAGYERRADGHEIALRALAVGLGDHLAQHETEIAGGGAINPQATRAAMLAAFREDVQTGALAGRSPLRILEMLEERLGQEVQPNG